MSLFLSFIAVIMLAVQAVTVALIVLNLRKNRYLQDSVCNTVSAELNITLTKENAALKDQLFSHIHHEINQLKDAQQLKHQQLFESLLNSQERQFSAINQLTQSLQNQLETSNHRLQNSMSDYYAKQQQQLHEILSHSTKQLNDQFKNLNQSTERHMLQINESMQNHLTKGFEKTNQTFTDIIQRLAIIDDAQKKITDLSKNVIDLQDILKDKRSRGAFGEVQLKTLIDNLLPPSHYAFQHTLSSGVRADCVLFLPKPTGHIIIDAKFPLENYQKLTGYDESNTQKPEFLRLFKQDIKKHIHDISSKYIIPNETADGAIMFIPAEAIFAEIHANHPDLIQLAHEKRVWLTSPTTLMAILTTAQSVIKDDLTRQQIHIIQQHLKLLAQDFGRFEDRMSKLSKHLQQANQDAEQVHTSAKKIAKKFSLIEKVDLDLLESEALESVSLTEFTQDPLHRSRMIESDNPNQERNQEDSHHA